MAQFYKATFLEGYRFMVGSDPRFNAFYLLTGVTFAAFASGFGVCLFNLDTVGACVQVADNWVEIFRQMGDHIIQWAIAIVRLSFHQ